MRRLTIGAATALTLVIVTAGAALATDAAIRPSNIHAGVCPEPGDVVAPLLDTRAAIGEAVGPTSAIPVEGGHTEVDLSLVDLVMTDHSIVVQHSPDDIGTYLVCGDVGGVPMGMEMDRNELAVGLAPVGDSTFWGVAWLGDNGDGTTSVTVFIADLNVAPMDEG